MREWSAGYVADIAYTYGYYRELNPLLMRLAFLNSGLAPPTIDSACELGFGQGLSVNIHGAASAVRWFGTDFNPSQAGFARELADGCGSGARLFDDAFADFASRTDLPEFDFIGIHGIWTWISDENRAVLVDFIRRRLRVGGVLYISYNTLPGWASFVPMRHLMTVHAEMMGAEGHGTVNRVDGALAFTEKLLATDPAYVAANAGVADRITKMKGQNRHYLAHEYFNRDWHPMHFATMAGWLEPAKLTYACTAHYLDHFDGLNLTAGQKTLLQDIPDPIFRESVRDFMVNQYFRRDYWVRGPRPLDTLQREEQLRAQRVILVEPRDKVSLTVTGALGEGQMRESIYAPVLDLLADHQVWTIGELAARLTDPSLTLHVLVEVLIVLIGAGTVAPAQDEDVVRDAASRTEKLNGMLINRARSGGDISVLASPVSGGGVLVSRFQQIFMLAASRGIEAPADWAAFAWETLSALGQKVVKDGAALESAEENLAELTAQAQRFALTSLPVLRALGVSASRP